MSTEIPQGELIPATPYAQKKGVSPKTLDRWVEPGLIDPPVRINGRKYYRDRAEAQEDPRSFTFDKVHALAKRMRHHQNIGKQDCRVEPEATNRLLTKVARR